MSLAEPSQGEIPAHGTRNFVHDLLNNLHLVAATPQQGLVHRPEFFGEARPEHHHSDDGRHLPGLLSLLCKHQHRGHETFHLSGPQLPLPDPDDRSPQEHLRHPEHLAAAVAGDLRE